MTEWSRARLAALLTRGGRGPGPGPAVRRSVGQSVLRSASFARIDLHLLQSFLPRRQSGRPACPANLLVPAAASSSARQASERDPVDTDSFEHPQQTIDCTSSHRPRSVPLLSLAIFHDRRTRLLQHCLSVCLPQLVSTRPAAAAVTNVFAFSLAVTTATEYYL